MCFTSRRFTDVFDSAKALSPIGYRIEVYACIVLNSCAVEKIISLVNPLPNSTNATMLKNRVVRSVTTIRAIEIPLIYEVMAITFISFLKENGLVFQVDRGMVVFTSWQKQPFFQTVSPKRTSLSPAC